jgi:hypothetical protein
VIGITFNEKDLVAEIKVIQTSQENTPTFLHDWTIPKSGTERRPDASKPPTSKGALIHAELQANQRTCTSQRRGNAEEETDAKYQFRATIVLRRTVSKTRVKRKTAVRYPHERVCRSTLTYKSNAQNQLIYHRSYCFEITHQSTTLSKAKKNSCHNEPSV